MMMSDCKALKQSECFLGILNSEMLLFTSNTGTSGSYIQTKQNKKN